MTRSNCLIYIFVGLIMAAIFACPSLAAQTDNSNGYDASEIDGIQIIKDKDGDPNVIVVESGPNNSNKIVQKARRWLADNLNVPLGRVKLVSIEQVDWPNSCLGVYEEDMACLLVITPGYKLILSAGEEEYELHTNLNANIIFMVQ